MTDKNILQEQQAYYSARAQEYDEAVHQTGRFATDALPEEAGIQERQQTLAALHGLGSTAQVLELACGTGLWTKELLKISQHLTALDGSLEMLEVNRAKLNDPRITYEQVDLFHWQPVQQYDLVFFAFWLSHVPPDALPAFLDQVSRAVKTGGRVFIVDEPAGGKQISGPNEEGLFQTRTLYDGRTFKIIKVYYDPADIGHMLEQRGFTRTDIRAGQYTFHLMAIKG